MDDPQARLTPSTPTTPTSPRALDLQQMGVTATRSTSTRTQVEFDQPQPGCSHWSTPSTTSTSRSQNSQNASITKMFEHVSSMKEGGSKYSSVTQSILYFICKDNRPFHVVKGEGFQRMVKTLSPSYKIPCTDTFKNILNEKYDVISSVLKIRLSKATHIALTTDVWTEMGSVQSYFGVTIHFLEEDTIISRTLSVLPLSDTHC